MEVVVKKTHVLTASIFSFGLAITLVLVGASDPQRLQAEESRNLYIIIFSTLILSTFILTAILKNYYQDYSLILHIPLPISTLVIVAWGLPTLAGFFDPTVWKAQQRPIRIDPVYTVRGWSLILVSLFCLWTGYIAGLKKQENGIAPRQLESGFIPSLTVVMQLYFGITILRLVRLLVTGIAFGAETANWGPFIVFNQTLSYLETGRFLFIAFANREVYRKRWPQSVLLVMLVTEVFFAFTSGFMKPIIWLGLVVLGSMILSGLRWKSMAFLKHSIIFLMLAILIVPIALNLRDQTGTFDSRSPIAVSSAVVDAYESTWGQSFETGWDMLVDKIIGRQAMVGLAPGIVLQRTPSELPYLGLNEFFSIPLYLVPRFLWLSKPTLSSGVWVSVHYLGLPESTNSSSAVTFVGEAYLFGGWPVTVVAMLLLGFILAKVFNYTVLNGHFEKYLALLPIMIDVEGQYVTLVVRTLQALLVVSILYYYVRRASTGRVGSKETMQPSVKALPVGSKQI